MERNGIVPVKRALTLYHRIKPIYLMFVENIEEFIEQKPKNISQNYDNFC
ncbi:MAG: hypothetical protein MJ054_00500 [Clostridia bacterium]|nr:hypothetical protein [Clostridia bacterium]